jgi:hypothetical protein
MSQTIPHVREEFNIPSRNCYSKENVEKIYYVYVIMTSIWIFTIVYLKLWNLPSFYIVIIPFITIVIGMYYADTLDESVESELFKASYLPVGTIILIPMLSWISKDYNGDQKQFIGMVIAALTFTLLTLIDIWTPRAIISVIKHSRSCFQTMSITLIILCLVTFYSHRTVTIIP